MKILFICLGSRGDVQPYVAIGKTAVLLGHEVTICTGKTFQEFVLENGLNFFECGLDFMAILQTSEGKEIFESGLKHPIKAINYAKRVINPLYRQAMSEFYQASEGMDVIVFHPKALGAVDVAEKRNIPCISMPLVPMIYPIKAFPNLAITNKNLGGWLNQMTYKLSNLGAESNYIKEINDFRVNELHLTARKAGAYMIKREHQPLPMIYPIAEALFPDLEELKNKVTLSGFPVFETPTELDQTTMTFIEQGPAPIIVTFSSMPVKDPQAFFDKIRLAIIQSGNRGIILVGNSGLTMESDSKVMIREHLPHDLVFKYAKGILHHGGVGTMAAALRSGKPQVMMPFNVDQPFWSQRLESQGYALPALHESDSLECFIDRFNLMQSPVYQEKAKQIADQLTKENPNLKALTTIKQVVESWSKNDKI